jgi:hypothetical protein
MQYFSFSRIVEIAATVWAVARGECMDHGEVLAPDLTPAARLFLRNHIHSVWQLELILFMKESNSSLSIADIARHLYADTNMIDSAMAEFVNCGILQQKGSQPALYAYEPSTPELIDAIEQAKMAYSNKRLSVINYIFSKEKRDGESS